MIKKLGYLVFTAFFSLFRICPVQKNKVFFVATHDDSDEGNAGIVADAIRGKMPEKRIIFLEFMIFRITVTPLMRWILCVE